MRITIELDEDLVLEARRIATESGLGLDAYIELQLQEWLAGQFPPAPVEQRTSQALDAPDLSDVDPPPMSPDDAWDGRR